MEAKTPHELNTQESINPEEKQQKRIGIEVMERLISCVRSRFNRRRFLTRVACSPFSLILGGLIYG
jgi:hypothetical protein